MRATAQRIGLTQLPSVRTIAAALNRTHALSPRAQQGRPSGWSSSTIRAVLDRPLYRGEVVYARMAKAYGRELLGKRSTREKGQIPKPAEPWIRRSVDALRIINADLAARVDARRADKRARYLTALAKGGRVPSVHTASIWKRRDVDLSEVISRR